jgi:tetratricopeptide (TPR) repeat protein
MRILFLNIAAALLLTSTARADGLSDTTDGEAALVQGEYSEAVRLFTDAITKGNLWSGTMESAYVERAKAYIGERQSQLALADLDKAAEINPDDNDIASLRAQVQKAVRAP